MLVTPSHIAVCIKDGGDIEVIAGELKAKVMKKAFGCGIYPIPCRYHPGSSIYVLVKE